MKPGAVKRFKLPESLDGIRFTVGRMVKMIQDARRDPLVISTARKIAAIATPGLWPKESERHLRQLRGIHAWCRANFAQVDDPSGIELIQTPNRMLRDLEIPPHLQKAMWKPIGKALKSKMPSPKMTGDADEATIISLALAAAIGIGPLKIRLGGATGTIYTCWGAANIGGAWMDFDILQEKFGCHAGVELIEDLEVPI